MLCHISNIGLHFGLSALLLLMALHYFSVQLKSLLTHEYLKADAVNVYSNCIIVLFTGRMIFQFST